ncbi:MAG: hypothetical protein DIU67_004925 [Actinomycetes bacterium]|jgi:hypothetical protein
MSRSRGVMFTASWVVLAAVSVLLVLAGGWILYSPGDAGWFSGLATLDLDALNSSDPDLAGHVVLTTRLLAAAAMGFGILSLFVTWFGVRDMSPLSVSVMWTLPILMATLGLILLLDGNEMVGLGFAVVAVVLSLALAIARRNV